MGEATGVRNRLRSPGIAKLSRPPRRLRVRLLRHHESFGLVDCITYGRVTVTALLPFSLPVLSTT